MEKNSHPIHIGGLIRTELTRQDKTVVWLADQLAIHRPNCYRILRGKSIDTDLLMRISNAMRHDFFAEYSKKLYFVKSKHNN